MRATGQLLVILLGIAVVAYGQGNSFKKIRCIGGTIPMKVKPKDWGNRLTVTSEEIELRLKDGQILEIDPRHVYGLSYGQEAHRRVGTMVALGILLAPLALFGLFHKTRLHFVGLEYTTEDGKKQGLLLQAHKKNFRSVLMALQGATGRAVVVAERDRKYIPVGVEIARIENSEKPGNSEKQSSNPEEKGILHVMSEPERADVWLDGDFIGNAPAQLKLAAGKHHIRVAVEGYEEWVREVEVLAGSELTISATLKKLNQRDH